MSKRKGASAIIEDGLKGILIGGVITLVAIVAIVLILGFGWESL